MEGGISTRGTPGTQSHLVDAALAREAVALALPAIDNAMRDARFGDSGFLHIVVMDPGSDPGRVGFEESILHEHSIGDRAKWDADYAMFARAKAAIAWKYRADSHRVQALEPHRLRSGDTTLWGSVWLDGIVVGVSGAFPMFDEMYAGLVAACLRALAKERAQSKSCPLFLP